jgi:hypothetical protein
MAHTHPSTDGGLVSVDYLENVIGLPPPLAQQAALKIANDSSVKYISILYSAALKITDDLAPGRLFQSLQLGDAVLSKLQEWGKHS